METIEVGSAVREAPADTSLAITRSVEESKVPEDGNEGLQETANAIQQSEVHQGRSEFLGAEGLGARNRLLEGKMAGPKSVVKEQPAGVLPSADMEATVGCGEAIQDTLGVEQLVYFKISAPPEGTGVESATTLDPSEVQRPSLEKMPHPEKRAEEQLTPAVEKCSKEYIGVLHGPVEMERGRVLAVEENTLEEKNLVTEIALSIADEKMAENRNEALQVEVLADKEGLTQEEGMEPKSQWMALTENVCADEVAVFPEVQTIAEAHETAQEAMVQMEVRALDGSWIEAVEAEPSKRPGQQAAARSRGEGTQVSHVMNMALAVQSMVPVEVDGSNIQEAKEAAKGLPPCEVLEVTHNAPRTISVEQIAVACQHRMVETTVGVGSPMKVGPEKNLILEDESAMHGDMDQEEGLPGHQIEMHLVLEISVEKEDLCGEKRIRENRCTPSQATPQDDDEMPEGQDEGEVLTDTIDESAHKKQKITCAAMDVDVDTEKDGDQTLKKRTGNVCMLPVILPEKNTVAEQGSQCGDKVTVSEGTNPKFPEWECTEEEARRPKLSSEEWLSEGAVPEKRNEEEKTDNVNVISAELVNADPQERLLWPPTVVVENTRTGKSDDGRWTGIGNIEMACFLRDINHTVGKPKSCWGKEGHRGQVLVQYPPTLHGLQEAERLHKHFAANMRSRKEWVSIRPFWHALPGHDGLEEGPDFLRIEEATQVRKRVFYGYLAMAEDIDKVFPPCNWKQRKKVSTLSRMQISAHKDPGKTIYAG